MTEHATAAQLENLPEPTAMTGHQLAEYVRGKLNLAFHLACKAEQERRSGHWQSAEEYHRQWEEAIAEVKRLLPLVRKSGVSFYATGKPEPPRRKR